MQRTRWGLGAGVAAAMVATALAGAPAQAVELKEGGVAWAMICSIDGVCVAYRYALADSDGDGVADIDEEAVGTSALDPTALPTVADLTAAVGKGVLPSFELGLSEVIVIPETLPDGTPLVTDGGLRASVLSQLDLGEKTLAQFGLSLSGGFTLDAAAAAIGMKIGKDGRPVRSSNEPPVQKRVGGVAVGEISDDENGPGMGDKPAFGTDRNGGKDTANYFLQEGKKLLFGDDKKGDKPDKGSPDGGTPAPKTLTTGDEGNVVIPLTAADMAKVIVKLNGTRTPVQGDPKVAPDITGVDFNPRRTIILTDDPEPNKRLQSLLKVLLVQPDLDNKSDRNTNYGPNGGPILGGIETGSGWPTI